MATIRANCPDCGDVELTTTDVTVRVCLDDDRGEYRFGCPVCAMTTVKPTETRTVDLLNAAGVHMESWTLPAELNERPSDAVEGINHDDILDFHRKLNDERAVAKAFAELEAA